MNLNLPIPLEDEDMWGILGRIRRLNALPNQRAVLDAIVRDSPLPAHIRAANRTVLALADALRVPRAQFIRKHTAVAVNWNTTHTKSGATYLGAFENGTINLVQAVGKTSGASICPKCTKQDIEQGRGGLWRRAHRLPGIEWCPNHGCQLVFVGGPEALMEDPVSFLESLQPQPITHEWSEHPVLKRLAQVELRMLDHEVPIDIAALRPVMRKRAMDQGIWSSTDVLFKSVERVAAEQLPHEWIQKFLPTFSDGLRGTSTRATQHCLYGNALPVSRLFVCATLICQSVSEAEALLKTAAAQDRSAELLRNARPNSFPKAASRRLYVQCSGDADKISKAVGDDASLAALSRVRDVGLPELTPTEPRLRYALDDFFRGDTIACVSQRHSISMPCLEQTLRLAANRLASAIDEIMRNEGLSEKVSAQLNLDNGLLPPPSN